MNCNGLCYHTAGEWEGLGINLRGRWSVKFAVNDATLLFENCSSLLFPVKCLLSREVVCFSLAEIFNPFPLSDEK